MSEAPKWPIIPAIGRIVPAKADLLKPNTSWSITFECIRGKNPFRVRFPGVAKFLLDRRISRYTKESIQAKNLSDVNSKDVTGDLQIQATGKNTVMFTPVTNLTIAKFGDATSPTLTHQVLENT